MANISFKGGDKWHKALSRLSQDKKIMVRAGVLEGATTTDGKPVAQYAAYNEFGAAVPVTRKMWGFFLHKYGVPLKKQRLVIPARPFMRNTLSEQREAWVRGVAAMLKAGRSPEEALQTAGSRMAEDIRAKILSNMEPRNSGFTERLKNEQEAGRAGTLVNTGALVRAIHFEVEK